MNNKDSVKAIDNRRHICSNTNSRKINRISMTKAFDRIRLKGVITTVHDSNVPYEITRLIYKLNTGNTTRIRTTKN